MKTNKNQLVGMLISLGICVVTFVFMFLCMLPSQFFSKNAPTNLMSLYALLCQIVPCVLFGYINAKVLTKYFKKANVETTKKDYAVSAFGGVIFGVFILGLLTGTSALTFLLFGLIFVLFTMWCRG